VRKVRRRRRRRKRKRRMGKTLEMRGNICFLEPQVSRFSFLFIYFIVASILFFEGGDLQIM
jgi:hypothetical protein